MNKVWNLIAGEDRPALSGEVLARENPADTGEQVAECPASAAADVDQAVNAALDASPGWARTPVSERCAMIDRGLEALALSQREIAVADVQESGKTLAECTSEVERALVTVRYQVAAAGELDCAYPRAGGGPVAALRRVPVGVVATITPWNFPFSAVLRKVVPALVSGNAVVAKPAELTPGTAACIGEAFRSAGLPSGVLNIVHGAGDPVGSRLVRHPGVGAISFTGSSAVGLGIAEAAGSRDVKVQLEMGGKNAMVVLADASIPAVADAALTAAFTAAGQWCVAASRLIIEQAVYDELVDAVAERADSLAVGNGLDPGVQMGPVVSAAQYRKVRRYLDDGPADSRMATKRSPASLPGTGYFIAPAVLADVPPDSPCAQDEVFGPVLACLPCGGLEEALALTNGTRYGLAASIYTEDAASAAMFTERAETGRVCVNLPPNAGDGRVPSSGRRASGRGEPEGGIAGIEFFTHPKGVFSAERR
jgi:aldehyde dehydrogenase (NAD+)